MSYGNQKDLLARIKFNAANPDDSRPIALLVGSGLTLKSVPGVTEIVHTIRKIIDEQDRADFDSETSKFSDSGHQYQAAFAFLSRRMPRVIADRVITTCTLKAYKPAGNVDRRLTPPELAEAEKDVDGWILPLGVESLGRIWAGLPANLRGPIITTNFDPLIEVAIQKAGAETLPRVMDADGTFIHDLSLSELSQIVHLHGFWRESQTLHMPTQLTVSRPALAASVRMLLEKYTLIVIGYSGWGDAVMMQLESIIDEQSARNLDVLWCSYGNDAALDTEIAKNSSLSKLTRAMGNVQFYTEIDANTAIPALETTLAEFLSYDDRARHQAGSGSLFGWTPIAETSLSGQGEESAKARALNYFDGRVPALRDGFNPFIPKRDIVPTIINELKNNLINKSSSLTFLIGASGEGKTTALIQAAAQASKIPKLDNIWINLVGKIYSIDGILNAPNSSSPLLLFLDEAHLSITNLKELATEINNSGRQNVHIIAATRDTDWTAVGGHHFAWHNYINNKRHTIKGMSRPDASAIVASWEQLGSLALGPLENWATTEERVSALFALGQDAGRNQGGTLFGAMLAIRYGEGLVEHIRNLLIRLRDRTFQTASGQHISLAEAFMYISIPHSLGINGLDHSVLSEALGISRAELEMNVLTPLGEESPIAIEGKYILTRHISISHAAFSIAEEVGINVEKFCTNLVKVAVREIDSQGPNSELLDLAYLSQKIDDPHLKVSTAQTAVDASPHRLSYRSTLSSAYRSDGKPALGADVGRDSVALFSTAQDRSNGVRVSLTEWGVCEGKLGDNATNAFLASLALADLSPDLDVYNSQRSNSLICLGVSLSGFGKMNMLSAMHLGYPEFLTLGHCWI